MGRPTTAGLPFFCSTGDVAATLGWSQDTIRRHLVPRDEWRRMVELDPSARFDAIPCIRIGRGKRAQYKIPRTWLEDLLAQGETPPEAEGALGAEDR